MVARGNEKAGGSKARDGLNFESIAKKDEVPPEFLPRKYGFEHDFVEIPLRNVIMLNQVRHDRNDQQTNLEQSIEEVGMHAFPWLLGLV
jgi:hypothetical protein